MKVNLTHIALQVNDIDASKRFYRQVCGMVEVHCRDSGGGPIYWLATPGQENTFVIVLLPGGNTDKQSENDFSHLGFAVDSLSAVDQVAERGAKLGCLIWAPRQEPFPVGYYCGLKDPDGHFVEFSFGQPLGPGSESLT